jgi:type I site-specific restriction-modification system R (restriction) subunit
LPERCERYIEGAEKGSKKDNTEGEEVARKEKLKTKWAQFEAIVGSENRVKIVARDLVAHFEERLAAMDGKAIIVCMSRRICVDLYRELIALRPASALVKHIGDDRKPPELLDHAIRQIVSKALVSDEIVDIFAAAGLKKPDISILSDEFLAEVRGMPQRSLAVELLRKLLVGEIKTRSQRKIVQARSFTELLERSIRRYQNRAIETAQVIEELIALAKDMRAANARGEELGLTEDELAFYDAFETNDSAVKVLGEPTLKTIARELVATVRKRVTIDWTLRENVRAQLRASAGGAGGAEQAPT